jgi:hypothetical protein
MIGNRELSIVALILISPVVPAFGFAPQSDTDIARKILIECAAIYHASRPCACPGDTARDGSHCGKRSAYIRPGGASPRCYIKDVSAQEIANYRDGKKDFTADWAPLP